MKTEHTPGPWHRNADTAWAGKNPIVCHPLNSKEAFLNATLVHAAPDMLEALRKAKNWMDVEDWDFLDEHDRSVFKETLEAINAAIKKATHP
jgi:hypothetical protein